MAMAPSPRRNSPDLSERFSMIDFVVGSEYIVEVTHINDPQSLYVRHISYKDNMDFLHLIGDPISAEQLEIGKCVIFQARKLDLRFIRGNIESINFNRKHITCNIFAIDFGFSDVDVLQYMIYLPASDLSIECPPLAVHCLVDQCFPKGETFNDFTIQAMRGFLGKNPAEITVVSKRDDKLSVILRPVHCSVTDVALWLAFLKLTKLSNGPENAPDVGEVIHFKSKKLKVGDKLSVRVQSGISIDKFYVADLKDYHKYESNKDHLIEHCKDQPAVDIDAAIDSSCCCCIKIPNTNEFERAIVLQRIEPDKALTKLVDWGTTLEVHCEDIKYTPIEALSSLPAMAIYCSTTVDQIWETEFPEFLHPGHKFMIEIVELGDGNDVPHKVNISPIPEK